MAGQDEYMNNISTRNKNTIKKTLTITKAYRLEHRIN